MTTGVVPRVLQQVRFESLWSTCKMQRFCHSDGLGKAIENRVLIKFRIRCLVLVKLMTHRVGCGLELCFQTKQIFVVHHTCITFNLHFNFVDLNSILFSLSLPRIEILYQTEFESCFEAIGPNLFCAQSCGSCLHIFHGASVSSWGEYEGGQGRPKCLHTKGGEPISLRTSSGRELRIKSTVW